jgi:adenylosuccinate lyase
MAGVAHGGNRQHLHELIRQHSHAVAAQLKAGAEKNDLLDRLKAEPAFAGIDWQAVSRPEALVGRAPEQVTEFIDQEIEPIRQRYRHLLNQTAEVSV